MTRSRATMLRPIQKMALLLLGLQAPVPCTGSSHRLPVPPDRILPVSTSGEQWDEYLQTPFLQYIDPQTNKLNEVWYGNARSLSLKYAYAKSVGAHGVGMWTANSLDYRNASYVKVTWTALQSFTASGSDSSSSKATVKIGDKPTIFHHLKSDDVAAGGMPAVGTFLEPWYTARGRYKWSFPSSRGYATSNDMAALDSPAADGCPTSSPLLFGDANGDGRDDLIQTGCGTAGDGWHVSISNGVSSWGNASRLWWRDRHPSSSSPEVTERFVADLNGDGVSDAVVWTLADGWTIGVSDMHASFGKNVLRVNGSSMECDGSSQRLVSTGALWCLGNHSQSANGSSSTYWGHYDVRTKTTVVQQLWLPATAGPLLKRLIGDVNNDTVVDAVVVDTLGNVFVAAGTNISGKIFDEFKLAVVDFFSFKTRAYDKSGFCATLLLAQSSAVIHSFLAPPSGGGSAMLVCAYETKFSTSWYGTALDGPGFGLPSTAAHLWKDQHGGMMSGMQPPSKNGSSSNDDCRDGVCSHLTDLYYYQEYHLADPTGSGTPGPIACNHSQQGREDFAKCCVMPAAQVPKPSPAFDPKNFEKGAVARSPINVNLWEYLDLGFEPELASGRFGQYDSGDLQQARFMFDRLVDIGVSFYITDNSNGGGVENTVESTQTLAALAAREYKGKMRYASMIGVNPCGPWNLPAALPCMEGQLKLLFDRFLNASDAAAKAMNGNGEPNGANATTLAKAAYRHPISGKPLVILYVEGCFQPMWDQYLKTHPLSIGHHFHVGYSDGQYWRDGMYGWTIDRSCATVKSWSAACSTATPNGELCADTVNSTASIRRSRDVMYVSPAFARLEAPPRGYVYKARDVDWFRSQFAVVAEECPSQLIVGCANDYAESNSWFPTRCPRCRTGEEKDPRLFWNAALAGLAHVRQNCAGTRPS